MGNFEMSEHDYKTKPSWSDAPDWAGFLAMDEEGEWWWFEKQPTISEDWDTWDKENGRSQCARYIPAHWHHSVEGRKG